jgi:hypothetical protein
VVTAIQIGSTTNAITLGNFNSANAATSYGMIIEGSVTGSGIWDGVAANGIDIGVGGMGVNLTGGLRLASGSTVSATAYQADALAIHLESGTVAPTIYNEGIVTASVTTSSANTATALRIEAGATVNTLNNPGILLATTTGDSANASAVIDKSGTLSNITNWGTISATLNPALEGEAVTGKAIALDLSANTTGVTLTQQLAESSTVSPAIVGDVLLGSGPNTVNLLYGTMKGALSMGSAASSLTIDGGASYVGALTYGGNALAINVANGTLQDNSTTTIGAACQKVGGGPHQNRRAAAAPRQAPAGV